MDLSKQIDSIVKGIVNEIQTQVVDQVLQNVTEQISTTIVNEIQTQLNNYNYEDLIQSLVESKVVDSINPASIERRIDSLSGIITNNLELEARASVTELVNQQVKNLNFNELLSTTISAELNDRIKEVKFPDNSIPVSSIKTSDLKLTGDHIVGGIIKNFGSTGIDDRASSCIVTILDQAVVVENNLVTLDLTVQGNLDVKGTVSETSDFYKQLTSSVTNSVQSGLNDVLFASFSDIIFNKIKDDGLDLNKITINGDEVISGTSLGYNITDSNLQQVGFLKELQVQGESLLAETVYVGNKRMGINTLEPSAALAVWDEEVEVTVSKEQTNFARLGTPRNQKLVLGSNRNNNVILHEDGKAQIDALQVGSALITSAGTPPSYASQRGHIVFNTNPNPGGPLGWVCLGAANWANFGIID